MFAWVVRNQFGFVVHIYTYMFAWVGGETAWRVARPTRGRWSVPWRGVGKARSRPPPSWEGALARENAKPRCLGLAQRQFARLAEVLGSGPAPVRQPWS